MLVKLAALGALGYAGYKYYRKSGLDFRDWLPANDEARGNAASEVELAGGPLSDRARLQSTADAPDTAPA